MTATEQSQLDRIEEMLRQILTARECENTPTRNEQTQIDLENQQRADAAFRRLEKRRGRL